MHIREYAESDLAALQALHSAQGFDYAFPDLRNPLFLPKLVLTGDDASVGAQHAAPLQGKSNPRTPANSQDGAPQNFAEPDAHKAEARAGKCDVEQASVCNSPILGAAFLRLTAEAYLFLDPHAGTPRDRWNWLLALHAAAERDAWQRGLADVHAWLPPPIAQRFGKRITQLGWRRDDSWTPYSKKLTL